MLKILRKKGVAKKVLWVLAGVIVISFVFFGTAGVVRDTGGLNYAGKIFGKKISFHQFDKASLHTRNQAILRYGENFDKISQFLNLDAETWDRLILLEEARHRRIKIKDQELVETIEQYPFFQRNGRFDNLLYNDILRYVFKSKSVDFEEGIRGTLTFAKLFSQETADVTISDEEALDIYKKQKEKAQVSYILFDADEFKAQASYDENKAKEFYEQNKASFVMPLTINVEFLNLTQAETASAEEKTKNQTKMNSVYEELQKNPDLKAVGQKYELEFGETGFFSQEEPNLKIGWAYELLQTAFELGKGEISQPIATPQGFSIIRVVEKRPEHLAEFTEIQNKIKDAMLLESAKVIAKEKAQDLQTKLKNSTGNTLAEMVEDKNLKIQQTPFFSKGEYLPNIGISKEFETAAFNLNDQNKLSEIVEIPKGYSILYLDSFQPAKQEDFVKEKEEFKKTLLDEKKNEKFNDFVATLRIKSNLKDNIATLKAQRAASN